MPVPSENKPPFARNVIYAVVVTAVALVLIEGVSRLAERALTPPADQSVSEPGWQTTFFQDLFDWHQSDPRLLWRFRPNLNNRLIKTNSRGLIADDIAVEKPPDVLRVMVVGDSSPVGLGLHSRAETFADVLKRRLETENPAGQGVEMINAAVSGYSSEQVVRFMEQEGWQYRPDVVIVYCGNNDASISGAYTDRELLASQQLSEVRGVLCRLALYRLLRAAILSLGPAGEPPPPDHLSVRVTPAQFGENLRQLARRGAEEGSRIILCEPPVPLLWPAGLQFKAFQHVSSAPGELLLPEAMLKLLGRPVEYCLDSAQIAWLYGKADVFTRSVLGSAFADSLPPEEAVALWQHIAARTHDDPVALNNLGVSLWKLAKYADADTVLARATSLFAEQHDPTSVVAKAAGSPFLFNRGINLRYRCGRQRAEVVEDSTAELDYLNSALQQDYFSLRIKEPYLAQIRQTGERYGVPVLNLPAVFRDHGGEHLFIDHCHPTATGHRLIAAELADSIRSPRR